MEKLLKAIAVAQDEKKAFMARLTQNETKFNILNDTVKDAFKNLELSPTKIDVQGLGTLHISEKGIDVPFSRNSYNADREKVIVDALVKFFTNLAAKYTNIR